MRLFSSPGNIDPMSIISSGSTRARGLSSRFSEEVNVLDFGAQGDGVTDDAPAFMAALASIYARKGGRLIVPASTAGYAFASPIVVDPAQYAAGNSITLELNGIPAVLVTNLQTVANTMRVNRTFPGVAIPHLLGNPALPAPDERALRRALTERALRLLAQPV